MATSPSTRGPGTSTFASTIIAARRARSSRASAAWRARHSSRPRATRAHPPRGGSGSGTGAASRWSRSCSRTLTSTRTGSVCGSLAGRRLSSGRGSGSDTRAADRLGLAARGLVALCLAVTLGAATAAAESERIQTDRPGVSTSAGAVRPGAVQVEGGATSARTSIGGSPADKQSTIELTLRGGLTERLEVRLEGNPLVVTRNEHDDTGLGNLTLDAKYRF